MQDRRRYPRANVAVDVIVEAEGSRWQGKTADLSPYGVKVISPDASVKLSPGNSVQVRFPVLDQHAPMSLAACVARTDPDGVALTFPTLADQQFRRLKELVDSLLLQEWQKVLNSLGALESPDARAHGAEESSTPPAVRQGKASAGERPGRSTAVKRATPLEPVGSIGQDSSERERLQSLLNRRGLGHLQLPDGALARQWREFLRMLEDGP